MKDKSPNFILREYRKRAKIIRAEFAVRESLGHDVDLVQIEATVVVENGLGEERHVHKEIRMEIHEIGDREVTRSADCNICL